MNPIFINVLIGIFFILIFGGLSLLKREGLSAQFAFEVLGITFFITVGSYFASANVNPVLFLILIYMLSMRGRILVDVANIVSNRGRQRDAMRLLQFALRLFPDRATYLVILVNMGIVQLRRQNPQSAKDLFESALKAGEQGGLGLKYEAACRYNLGLALLKLGKDAEAVRQLNEVVMLLPNSIFSRAAEIALQKHRTKHQMPKAEESLEDTFLDR